MLFKKTPQSQVELFKTQSDSAITIVKNVIVSLKTTNEAVDAAKLANSEKISELEQENKLLDALVSSNAKIVENFENLLS